MFAVTAARVDADNPLTGLVLGEHADPSPPQGWTTVTVKATSLNHHDVWTLRGVGISADRLPIVLGCDAAGVDEDGNEVVVYSVIGDPEAGGGDETLDPSRSLLSERYDGTFAERVAVPRRNLLPKPSVLVLRRGSVPADRVPDRLPHAVRQDRAPAGRDGSRPGRRRRRRDRADPARPGRRLPGVGDQPQRGQAGAGRRAGRGSGVSRPAPGCPSGWMRAGDGRARPPGRIRCARSSRAGPS